MPTGALPLKLVRRTERAVIERALSAPTPFTRLIAVVSRQRRCSSLAAMLSAVGLRGVMGQQLVVRRSALLLLGFSGRGRNVTQFAVPLWARLRTSLGPSLRRHASNGTRQGPPCA